MMTPALSKSLDSILSHLAEDEALHRRMGGQLRKLSLRGFARMSDAWGVGAYKFRGCLEKVLGDNCKYYPTISMDPIIKAEAFTMSAPQEIKNGIKSWKDNLDNHVVALNVAIEESRSANIQLYDKLCCRQDLTQHLVTKLEILWGRLELAGWGGHDLGIVSMILHKYYEDHPDGDCHDWNVG